MSEDVTAARAGDRAAFARLVVRFRNLAIGYAAGWVGDQAEDVAQDAFIDAFLRLHQLEQPAAFPAWLRQIVRKHCDRRTRRIRAPAPVEEAVVLPDEDALDQGWLRGAIGRLPEHERVVVALHYLAGETQQDIAAFLELPVSTVKKRMFSARARLRARRDDMQTIHRERFADRIGLFLAIRARDVAGASSILDRHPELLSSEEQWTTEGALGGGLPLAHRVPPLVLAASRGDAEMVRMLLARGAEVDGGCGCPNGETALWIASRCGHEDIAQALLAAGADPDRQNRAGFRPAEAARLRAGERVRVAGGRIETGIKAIDLLAPLEPGMLVRVHGQAETGLMALSAELTSRFEDAVWVSLTDQAWQENDLWAFAADTGIEPRRGGDFEGRTLFVFSDAGRRAELEALLPRLRAARIAFVIDPWLEATREGVVPALAAPFDALIATDPELARADIYPAIDRRHTRSNVAVSERHAALVEAVRGSDDAAVLALFGQWFGVWQHRTGRPGEHWALDDTLAAFEQGLSAAPAAR
jgi:RNA polymerase sigma factor (sigma-70 family)